RTLAPGSDSTRRMTIGHQSIRVPVTGGLASDGRTHGRGSQMLRRVFLPLMVAVTVAVIGLPHAVAAPPTGWAGEFLVGAAADDDWEPSIAADPAAPYVYVMYNRYGGAKACAHCPSPAMLVQTSSDAGATWGSPHFICTCSGVPAQYDPVLRVTSTGTVYAS